MSCPICLIEKIDSDQCDNCFSTEDPIKIVKKDDNCMICFENANNIVIYKCGNWICIECYKKSAGMECPICSCCMAHAASKDNKIFTGELKPHFKILYSKAKELCHMMSGGSHNTTITMLEEYEKWLCLVRENHQLSPGPIIGELWRYHILRTKDYRKLCEQIGEFINYSPTLENDKTVAAYNEKYGNMKHRMLYWMFKEVLPYDGHSMQIFVKDLTGSMHAIDISPRSTVLAVKIKVYQKNKLPISQQRMICGGRQLENNKTLKEYNIQKESTLHIVLNLRGC